MKKLFNKPFFSIVPILNGVFAILSAHGFIIYDCNKGAILFKSPPIKNISTVLCNESRSALLAVNTYGNIVIFSETTIKAKTKIRQDASNYHLFSNKNDFYCIGLKYNLIVINKYGEKISTVFSNENIHAVFKNDDVVYVIVLTRNSSDDSLDVTSEIFKCKFSDANLKVLESVYKANGFVNGIKLDVNGENVSVLFDKPYGEGRNNDIVIFSPNTSHAHVILDFVDIQNKLNNQEFLVNYATNINKNFLALLLYDELVVWDYVSQKVIYRENFENGTDVVWVSDNKLLVTSWFGLFEIAFNNTVENQSGDGTGK